MSFLGTLKSWFIRRTAQVQALKTRFDGTAFGRAAERFGHYNGSVLASGIAFYALTSVAAALVIVASIAALVMSKAPGIQDNVVEFAASVLPGLVAVDGAEGLISAEALFSTRGSSAVGVLSLLVLLNTASRYVGGLRAGLRTMLGKEAVNPFAGKALDLAALAGLLVAGVTGVAFQVLASRAAHGIAEAFDQSVSSLTLRAVGLCAGLVADALFALIALALLGGARHGKRLAWVVLGAAVAMTVLRFGVTYLVAGTLENPVLAPFAAVITLLVFVDFVNRVLLMAAAWLGAVGESRAGAAGA